MHMIGNITISKPINRDIMIWVMRQSKNLKHFTTILNAFVIVEIRSK